jgi:hypothetical protein
MTITERVQEVFNKFNVKLTVTEEPRTEMAEAALDNGTVIYTDADAFAEGVEAYIINDEGEKIPLPAGEYTLADGGLIVVGEGGIVSSVGEAPAEEVVEEVEASEEIEAEEEPGYVTKAQVEEMIKAALEALTEKEEMSVNPEAPKEVKEEKQQVVEEVVDEVAVELAAVKAELADLKKQAAEAGLKHKAPAVKREPINLKNLSTQERVSALLQNFSK